MPDVLMAVGLAAVAMAAACCWYCLKHPSAESEDTDDDDASTRDSSAATHYRSIEVLVPESKRPNIISRLAATLRRTPKEVVPEPVDDRRRFEKCSKCGLRYGRTDRLEGPGDNCCTCDGF